MPPVPMMSLFATLTNSGRLSGVGNSGNDDIGPLQPPEPALAKDMHDRRVLHRAVQVQAAWSEVRREVDLERSRDPDERHWHHARPDVCVLDIVQVVRRVDQHAADGRADQAGVDVRCVRRREFGGPLAGDRTTGIAESATFASLAVSTADELNAARIESRVFIPYSGPAAKISAPPPSVSGRSPWTRVRERDRTPQARHWGRGRRMSVRR